MDFLTGPREEIAREYITYKKVKGKYVIPIGGNSLQLKTSEIKTSKSGNEMIVLTIRKLPDEIDEVKVYFKALIFYYTEKMLYLLRNFIRDALSESREYKSMAEAMDHLKELKGRTFDCVVFHQKRLLMQDGKPMERQYSKSYKQSMLPLVAYEPKFLKLGTQDIGDDDHRHLIKDFNTEEKEIFNKLLLDRYIKLHESTNN